MTTGQQKTTAERFWSKVDRRGDCWMWTKARNKKGYGIVSTRGKFRNAKAHRVAWQLENGPITEEQCVLHRCDNPACCRPSHLFLGTRADNNEDMRNKGRNRLSCSKTPALSCKYPRGERHHHSRLTAEKVLEIRAMAEELGLAAVCRAFGIDDSHAHKIITRKLWKHV